MLTVIEMHAHRKLADLPGTAREYSPAISWATYEKIVKIGMKRAQEDYWNILYLPA